MDKLPYRYHACRTTGNMEIQVLIFPKPKLKETLEVAHENFRV